MLTIFKSKWITKIIGGNFFLIKMCRINFDQVKIKGGHGYAKGMKLEELIMLFLK